MLGVRAPLGCPRVLWLVCEAVTVMLAVCAARCARAHARVRARVRTLAHDDARVRVWMLPCEGVLAMQVHAAAARRPLLIVAVRRRTHHYN